MLCDIMYEKRLRHSGFSPQKPERLIDREAGVDVIMALPEAERKHQLQLAKQWREAILDFLEVTNILSDDSIGEDGVARFREKLEAAHKLHLSPAFAAATLNRLATEETVVRAREHFRLPHDPVWIEWYFSKNHNGEDISNFKLAALLWQEEGSPLTTGYFIFGTKHTELNIWTIHQRQFDPSTLASVNGKLSMITYMEDGTECGDDDFAAGMAFQVVDFLIRINSPRITEIRQCDDLTALNKKRIKNGKLPLFSYHVVDLNKQVKESLKLMDKADEEQSQGKRRLHWRRGHFKCCRTGIFWWNPHLAGRADLGRIDKHYAA